MTPLPRSSDVIGWMTLCDSEGDRTSPPENLANFLCNPYYKIVCTEGYTHKDTLKSHLSSTVKSSIVSGWKTIVLGLIASLISANFLRMLPISSSFFYLPATMLDSVATHDC
jgi:hypothetical protein